MQTLIKFNIILLLLSPNIHGQNSEIDRLIQSEFKMTFPSIYFKHQSTDYTKMPYSVDSCFKYIASRFDENSNSLVIWRDTAETEDLTINRIKKLKSALKKHLSTKEFEIYSMGNDQKVSRHTIKMSSDSSNIKYLLTLNSVFDISKTRRQFPPSQSHIFRPRLFCWNCIKRGYHMDKKSRDLRSVAKRSKKTTQTNTKQ